MRPTPLNRSARFQARRGCVRVVVLVVVWCVPALVLAQSPPDARSPASAGQGESAAAQPARSEAAAEDVQAGQEAPQMRRPAGEAAPAVPDARAALAQLEAQINAMLTPDGLVAPDAAVEGDVGDRADRLPASERLERIASRSREVARQHEGRPTIEYQARQVELRAYNALAQDAVAHDRAAEASYRLTQLRNAATRAKRADNRFAEATGGFWLLLADLTDINRNTADIAGRQAQAVSKLEAYLDAHEADATPEAIGTRVTAALIRLHTQRGDNARACELLAQLREGLPAGDAHLASLSDVAAVCELIGQRAAFEVQTLSGGAWSVAGQAGSPVLIHFYADWSPHTRPMFESIEARAAAWEAAGVSLLSVSVGPTRRGAADQPWPVAQASWTGPGPVSALDVRGLPWLVVLDERGVVRSAGQSDAVFERLDDLLESRDAAETDPPAPDTGSAGDQG